MKPHEIIEVVITSICAVHGVKWQDVFKAKRKSALMDIKHVIAHILTEHIGREAAGEVMGYSKYNLYHCDKKHWAVRDNYREIERYISKTIKEAA